MVWCGLISYPLYLWHWPFLSFGYIIFGHLSPAKAAICVVAAVIAAFLTYALVERPIRRAAKTPRLSLVLLGGMAVVLAAGVLAMTKVVPPRLKSFDVPAHHEWDFLGKLRPDLKGDVTGFYPIHPERPTQVLMIGDSHLVQYAARFDKVIGEDPQRPGAVLGVAAGCIPIDGWGLDGARDKCASMKTEAYAKALEPRFKTVVIGGAWDIYFSEVGQVHESGGRKIALTAPEGRKLALEHLGQRITALRQAGKDVVLILDSPVSNAFNPTGPKLRLSLSTKNFQANGVTRIDARQHALHQELAAWARTTGARIIDPSAFVCDGDVCQVTTPSGQPLYRNRDHFNPDWAIDHATFIDEAVR